MNKAFSKAKINNNPLTELICFLVLMIVLIPVLLWFGNEKQGFHEDEYYTYYSSNRTAGLFVEDRSFLDTNDIYRELCVNAGEGFNYSMVKLVQSWDVHPPFYYYVFHTVCSLMTGQFSKWSGIVANLPAYVGTMLLFYLFLKRQRIELIPRLVICLIIGIHPMMISGVMFVRMYMWLTLFVVALAYLHFCLYEALICEEIFGNKDNHKGLISKYPQSLIYILSIAIVTYLGFLTQYYFLIFLVFQAFALGLLFAINRKWKFQKDEIKLMVVYVFAEGLALVLALLSYTAAFSHIFRGYRGTEAKAELLDITNLAGRIRFFFGLLNEYVFDGMLVFVLILGLLIFVRKLLNRSEIKTNKDIDKFNVDSGCKRERTRNFEMPKNALIWIPVIAYYLTIMKTALVLGNTSNRYELPVYGLLLMLICVGVCRAFDSDNASGVRDDIEENEEKDAENKKQTRIILTTVMILFLVMDLHSLASGKVLFLYPEQKEHRSFARTMSEAGAEAVVVYNEASPYNIWREAGELLEYSRIYTISEQNRELVTEPEIIKAKELAVYVAKGEDADYWCDAILAQNSELLDYEQVYETDMWCVYRFY